MISSFERDQRLRDINHRLREIMARRASIDEQWHGAPPLDISAELSALAEEMTNLRAERLDLQEPEFTPVLARQYVNRVWEQVNDLVKLMRWTRRGLIALSVWALLMTLAITWLGGQVWQITSLWR